MLLSSLLLKAESLDEILSLITANPQLKTAQEMSRSAAAQYAAQKSANYPSLDLFYSATYLFEWPIIYMKVPGASATLQIQSQNQYDGSLRLSYALFSVFAISSGIFLSGDWTPIHTMHPALQYLSYLSPLRYYIEGSQSIFFRGTPFGDLLFYFGGVIGVGSLFFLFGFKKIGSLF